jgi:hypothetical protein
MIRILHIFFISISISSCSQKFSSTELENNFTEAEIRDLHKLTEFFQEQMCNDKGDFNSCMDSLIPFLGEYGWQPILESVDFKKQQSVYESLESNLFKEIWNICKSRNPREGWESKSLCLNTAGKYVSFLEAVGERNGVLEAYKDDLLRGGDFYGIQRIEYEVFNKTDRIDLSDPSIQVLFAVHYLTQNDQQKRKEPWTEN